MYFILESNRIFPALFGLGKICTEKYEMDLGRGKMLVIEKDTTVFIPTYAINNDPMHWSDVEQFKPERFANNESVVAKNKGIFLPFGDGPRMCIGKYLIRRSIDSMKLLTNNNSIFFLRSQAGNDAVQSCFDSCPP